MSNPSKTWLVIAVAALLALTGELVTVLVWGYPMSYAMEGAPSIVIAGVGLAVGVLFGHFWWPAKARWKDQDEAIERFGPPWKQRPFDIAEHAARLWLLHTEGK